jgi:hypothetical protein
MKNPHRDSFLRWGSTISSGYPRANLCSPGKYGVMQLRSRRAREAERKPRLKGSNEILCHSSVCSVLRSNCTDPRSGPHHHLAPMARKGRVSGTNRRPLSWKSAVGTLLWFRAIPNQHQENQNLDDSFGHRIRAGCCAGSRKTLRNSQSHQLDHGCAQRPLELDCTGDPVDKSPLICGANRVSESIFHRTDAGAPGREAS